MDQTVTRLFTYGSLKPQFWNHARVERWVHSTQLGWTEGALLDLGRIPALVPDNGIVEGVVLTLDKAALISTDALEGHSPDQDRCWYRRRLGAINCGGGRTCAAWLYEYARPESIADRPRLLIGKRDGVPVYRWDGDRLVLDCGELVVSCRLSLRVRDADTLIMQLRRACRAWDHVSSPLMMYDLRAHLTNPDLRRALSLHGIDELCIDTAFPLGLGAFAHLLNAIVLHNATGD